MGKQEQARERTVVGKTVCDEFVTYDHVDIVTLKNIDCLKTTK
jgi:hypothetical protein